MPTALRRLLAAGPAFSGSWLAVGVAFITGAGLRLCGAEGVGDPLVGGVSLPVDAVGVDLQQDGDAVPGAAGDLGGGHPGVEPQRDRRVPQVIRAAAQRRPVLGRVRAVLRAWTQTSL